MTRVFTVIHTLAGIEYERVCKGYAEASQVCATFVKAGIYPKIEIQYINDDWDESMVDNNARNFTE